MRDFEGRLVELGVSARRMRTSHAFHSSSMDSVIDEFESVLRGLTLRAPNTPLLSNTTGTWMSAEEATDPARWARQIRATVKFSDQLDTVLADPKRVLVEVGPGGSLTASAARQPRWSDQHRAVRLIEPAAEPRRPRRFPVSAWPTLGGGSRRRLDADADDRTAGTRLAARLSLCTAEALGCSEVGTDDRDGIIPSATVTQSPSSNGSHPGEALTREQQIEATLQRIWSESLGRESIDRNADFFELGGDSVSAISIATNWSRRVLISAAGPVRTPHDRRAGGLAHRSVRRRWPRRCAQ